MELNVGVNQLAGVLQGRNKAISAKPSVIDVGEIQGDFSLLTNKFPVPIPLSDYMVCRSVLYGQSEEVLTKTQGEGAENGGNHSHSLSLGEHDGHEIGDGAHVHEDLQEGSEHIHDVLVGEKLRSLQVGDRVLVAWIDSCDPCVIDLIFPATYLS